ncbi:MAG: family 10 glycosylhydrolase [Geothrix sp.]|nr:family 10 glycosylhydrolase [Geothrix sp.]
MVRHSLKDLRDLAFLAGLALAGLLGCVKPPSSTLFQAGGNPASSALPPAAPREFRAAWVATVANIDWPSARGLSADIQKTEARNIISQARALGLNALILQVRPAADALYPSRLEPWSEYLTGTQGQPPEPLYDPLAFWIEEAHRAGLELHAWFNPYRARQTSSPAPLAPGHVANTRPDLVRAYGDQLWLDPGAPGAVEHVLAVILDVVRRYDVDGVHFDDYFYPYPILDAAGQQVDFPDEPSWRIFLAGGGTLSRADWRRRQVDRFVERVYREVHREKPHVRVGVSPFGIGRPDRRPPGITGFSQYDGLYADVELWLEQGWMDYLAPQLYWKRDSAGQSFSTLLDYWLTQNPEGRHVWPGLFTSRTGSSDPWPAEEITGQIQLTRTHGGSTGHAHFSMIALKQNHGGITARLADIYDGPALVPATTWLGGTAPPAPSVRLLKVAADPTAVRVELTTGDGSCLLALWGRYGPVWRFFTLPGGTGTLPAQSGGKPLDLAFASSVGRTGLESPRVAARDERN